MPAKSSLLKTTEQQLARAERYDNWLELATQVDDLSGGTEWRNKDRSDLYPGELIGTHLRELVKLRQSHDPLALISYLRNSLHRTLGEIYNPDLYQFSLTGTKLLIEDYLTEVEACINYLCDGEFSELSHRSKIPLFEQATRNIGRTALMLSGGGTFGIYHLGVVKSLLERELLPNVISGTSMGSIVAGLLAVHTDQELATIFDDPTQQNHQPLRLAAFKSIWQQKALLDPDALLECIIDNIGELTFGEAFKRTGREVSITVSPLSAGQKPRILNHLTAPEIIIAHAAVASCAIPGLFPAAKLASKDNSRGWRKLQQAERWVDGSFATDIPRERVMRLFNVNHFIVSQANPHILPFVRPKQKNGITPLLTDAFMSTTHAQWHVFNSLIRRRIHRQPWRSWLDHVDALLSQDYAGDINLWPELPPSWYLKFMKNPSAGELKFLILTGERAVWPNLPIIRDQTRLSRTLTQCLQRLTNAAPVTSDINSRAS